MRQLEAANEVCESGREEQERKLDSWHPFRILRRCSVRKVGELPTVRAQKGAIVRCGIDDSLGHKSLRSLRNRPLEGAPIAMMNEVVRSRTLHCELWLVSTLSISYQSVCLGRC